MGFGERHEVRDDLMAVGGWVVGEAAGRRVRRQLLAMNDVQRGYAVLGVLAMIITAVVLAVLVL